MTKGVFRKSLGSEKTIILSDPNDSNSVLSSLNYNLMAIDDIHTLLRGSAIQLLAIQCVVIINSQFSIINWSNST